MGNRSLGQELVAAVREALASKETGTVVRPKINLVSMRRTLGMTQREFAKQYHIKLQTLQNWEQGKRYPDTTSLAYLICIASQPKLIQNILKQK